MQCREGSETNRLVRQRDTNISEEPIVTLKLETEDLFPRNLGIYVQTFMASYFGKK
jgi:hypothetical protein